MVEDAPPPRRGRPSTGFPLVERRPLSDRWPEADRQAWATAIAPADGPLGDAGPAAHLSPSSKLIREKAYGSFLCWLETQKLLDRAASPAARMEPAWVAGWLAETCGRLSARTADMALVNLSLSIEAMVPGNNCRWMRKLPGRPSRVAVRASMTASADARPKPPDTVHLAVRAMEFCAALDDAAPSIKTALDYRDGLIIALACYHAPRLSNLAEIQIGIHLLPVTDDVWRLRYRKTKNSVPLTPHLGMSLVPYLKRYLSVYRPLLLRNRDDHGFLWVSRRGGPLAATAFRGIFQGKGQTLIGVRLNAHQVRHGMATGLMQANPRSIRTAAAALGHRSTGSVNQVYDRSDISVFSKEWARILKEQLGP